MYTYSEKIYEIYNDKPMEPEEIWEVREKETGDDERIGSRLDAVVEEASIRLQNSKADRVAIVILTDGENTGNPVAPLVEKLNDSRLKVVLIGGLIPEFRLQIRKDFTSISDKLVLCGVDDSEYAVEEFETKIRDAEKI